MISYEVRREAADVVEEILNELLTQAWQEYVTALESGTKLELEARATSFVRDVMREKMTIELPAHRANELAVADRIAKSKP